MWLRGRRTRTDRQQGCPRTAERSLRREASRRPRHAQAFKCGFGAILRCAETLGQLNAARACVYGVPASRSELPVEPCVAPARRRRIAARPEGCPNQCPTNSEAVN
jgi:hypothetical protein